MKYFSRTKNFLLTFFLSLFLIFNIVASQMISPFFLKFIKDNKQTTIEFLQKIKSSPFFNQELVKYENIYGNSLKNKVFLSEIEQNREIIKLEQVLEKNPQSRDVLYSLYSTFKDRGDNLTAEKYLRLAKTVDPSIK